MISIRMQTAMVISGLAALLAAAPASAQGPWTVDVRAGAAFPTGNVGDDGELDTGFGFDGAVGYRFMEHLSAYAGWGRHKFTSGDSFAGADTDFEETGYQYGLRWEHPFSGESGSGPAYRIRAGGTYNHIEVEDADGEIVSDSGHGAGWEIGAGVTFGLGDSWRLAPEVRYRSLSRDIELDEATTEVDLQYVALDVGVTWAF